jgi:hypothetical protein
MGGIGDQVCDGCRHWRWGDKRRRRGECRRYPPLARGYGVSVWPVTRSDDGCGEWAAQPVLALDWAEPGAERAAVFAGGSIHPHGLLQQASERSAFAAQLAALDLVPIDETAAKRAAAEAYTRAYRAKAKARDHG